MWHIKGYVNEEPNDILSVSEISSDSEDNKENENRDQRDNDHNDDNRRGDEQGDNQQPDTTGNVRPRYEISNTLAAPHQVRLMYRLI